jgi:hypothetical protein
MKKLLFAVSAVLILGLYSCESEPVGNEDLKGIPSTAVTNECVVIDADRCPFTIGGTEPEQQPMANMWWPGFETDFFSPSAFFASSDEHSLTFTEYEDGTAHIAGTTGQVEGDCVVKVDVWLKNRMSWEEWSSAGGEYKREGCVGENHGVNEEMSFYIIDSERSTLTSMGGDCLGEDGTTYGLVQRPDPDDLETPNYGAHVGPNGANYDSEAGANGLSTWGWITDLATGEKLWIMDFNFKFDCKVSEPECETAFAYSGNNQDCFLNYDFNRWGWSIPVSEGTTASYDVYAGAGQCDLTKGELVGTVDISYVGGELDVVYNIDSAYDVTETHTYAGSSRFPMNKKGKPTVAPGKYSIQKNLSGDIYVIAHAVVCGE